LERQILKANHLQTIFAHFCVRFACRAEFAEGAGGDILVRTWFPKMGHRLLVALDGWDA
jgi:hypothetical protein